MPLVLKTNDDTITVTDAELVPDGASDVTFTLRHITIEKNREVVREKTTSRPNPRTHQMDKIVNWEAVGDELLDYALVEWTGVLFEGKPIACAGDNKLLLDGVRRAAILEKAGMNEVQNAGERKAKSFRPPA